MSDLKADVLEDYNPFGDPLASTNVSSVYQPAVLPPSDSGPPPAYPNDTGLKDGTMQDSESTLLPSTLPALTVADLQRRQAELDQRAAQLDLREKQAQQQEAWRMEHGYATADIPNWPPLPRWCCFKPCIRVDFNSDIPSHTRWMAVYGHYFWLAYSCLLLLNVFGTLSYLVVSKTLEESGALFGVSIVVFLLLTPASCFCWNRPLYKALRKNSSMQFCLFFPFFGAQILIIFIQLLGIDYLGACGWINSLKVFASTPAVGAFMLVLAALFTIAGAAAVYLISRVHMYYRSSGASVQHAKQELVQDMASGGFTAIS
uniref:Secretory carrier-associated membrane protein n=1 Tax=Echinococcus granulosus TaxID=6210 RepID=A0A068WJG6_ECHGR|nr:secretory carrier associated membrane protein 1 [Echinococcus granulosus]